MHWGKFEQKKCKQYNHIYFLKQNKNKCIDFEDAAVCYLLEFLVKGFLVWGFLFVFLVFVFSIYKVISTN